MLGDIRRVLRGIELDVHVIFVHPLNRMDNERLDPDLARRVRQGGAMFGADPALNIWPSGSSGRKMFASAWTAHGASGTDRGRRVHDCKRL